MQVKFRSPTCQVYETGILGILCLLYQTKEKMGISVKDNNVLGVNIPRGTSGASKPDIMP